MKKLFILISIIGLTMFLFVPQVSGEPPLTVVTEDWPPYNYSDHGVVKGFSVELVSLIMKKLNRKHKILLLPSARIINYIDNNPDTIFITMIRTPDREHKYKWIGPIDKGEIYFYKKKGNPLILKSVEDAKNVKSVCCRHRGLVLKKLEEAGFTNLDKTSYPAGIYLKVVHGRCDLGIGETSLGVRYWLTENGISADLLEMTPLKLINMNLYIAAGREIPDDEIKLLQTTLDMIEKTGEYAKIYNRYLSQER